MTDPERKQGSARSVVAADATDVASSVLREAIDAMPDGFVLFDPEDRLVFCNSAYRRMFAAIADALRPGTPYGELIAATRRAFPDQDREPFGGEDWAGPVLDNHLAADGVITVRHPDGRWLRFREKRTARGHTVCIRTDLTDLIEARNRLRDNEEKFRTLFDFAPVGVVLTDIEGLILEGNPAFAELTGSPVRSGEDRIDSWLAPDAAETVRAALAGLERSERYGPIECDLKIGTGEDKTVLLLGGIRRLECGPPQVWSILQDITERKRAEREIWVAAHSDPVTGLPNRTHLAEHLEALVRRSGGKRCFGLVLVDLDDFKLVNDTLGHEAGDVLLRHVAGRLRGGVRQRDFVARLGGDEFALVFDASDRKPDLDRIARRLLRRLATPVSYRGHSVRVNASFGLAMLPDHGHDVETLMRAADLALYAAKHAGGNRAAVFKTSMLESAERRFRAVSRGRAALEEGRIVPAFQPIFDLQTGRLAGLEALMRLADEDGTLVRPSDIGWIFEDPDVGRAIDLRMLELVLDQIRTWSAAGLEPHHVSINLCEPALWGEQPGGEVLRLMRHFAVDPGRIRIEITETHVLGDIARASAALAALGQQGLRFSLDDFGTGHASLTHLKSLPVTEVKIDRSFVGDIETSDTSRTIVEGLVAICHGLGKTVVAEGIETPGQAAILTALGCDYGQGFHLGHPAPAGTIEAEILRAVHRRMGAPGRLATEPRRAAGLS